MKIYRISSIGNIDFYDSRSLDSIKTFSNRYCTNKAFGKLTHLNFRMKRTTFQFRSTLITIYKNLFYTHR